MGMAFPVEHNVPRDPLDITILGARRVMSDLYDLAYLIEQTRRPRPRKLASIHTQYIAVQKVQGRASGLDRPHRVLLRLSHMAEKAANFAVRQLAWMPLAMEQYEPRSPVHEFSDRIERMPARRCDLAKYIEQSRWRGRRRFPRWDRYCAGC